MTAVLTADGLTKRFGPVVAVDGLDLEVGPGEVFGFLGPNGAGKTTTIRLFLDMLRPDGGSATILGRDPRDVAVRGRVGFMPAELHLDRRHTAGEAIGYLGDLRGGFERAEVDALLERFDLDPSRRVGELSTGNRRKIGVVVAFAGRSELLILDEPSSGLDPLLQHELLSLIEERAAEGTTVFLSSHVLHEVQRVATRVAILRRGSVALTGPIGDLGGRTRHHIELQFREAPEATTFERVPGVVSASANGRAVRLVVDGPLDAVVKRAAGLTVERMASREADLDEIFMELYR